ncbi:MAG: peptidylprolyl isomerase [Acetobacteraceae bacterium]|nr:peptidylprolyl isomerase [Acetobacteraceae bacterium]
MRSTSLPKPVSVNGVVIANADIAREVQNHNQPSPAAAWEAATRALVVRELLAQRARDLDLVAMPHTTDGVRETEEEALIRVLLKTEIHTPRADEASCRRYYTANQSRFRSPDLFEPLHILFKAAQSDEAAYAQALTRAETVLADIQAAPDRFESHARALSDCPSAQDGGRLGQVERGETTPEFEAALLTLQPSELCPLPVRTRYGVHILRLDRKVEGTVLPFDRVRSRIGQYLEDNAARRAAAQYVALLAGQAQIDGCAIAGAASPLMR